MSHARIPAAVYRAEMAGKTAKKDRGNKYSAQKTVRNGITFDSKREADRYDQLTMLARGGVIFELRRQVRIDLLGSGGDPLRSDSGRALYYLADFSYHDDDGARVYEDAKGVSTRDFKIKKAILRAQGVEIIEV